MCTSPHDQEKRNHFNATATTLEEKLGAISDYLTWCRSHGVTFAGVVWGDELSETAIPYEERVNGFYEFLRREAFGEFTRVEKLDF